MSVVIKGKDIPQSCYMCDMIELSGAISCLHANNPRNSEQGRALDCPLIELPDHGDLIDRDALPKYTGYALSANDVANAVINAKAVIPAERNEAAPCDDCDERNVVSCSRCRRMERSEE